jgi:hypothetical protein
VSPGPSGPSAAELEAKSSKEADELTPRAEGEVVPVLDSMPPATVSLMALPSGFEGATLRVTFSPYGWGQGGPEACNLFIDVEEAEPASGDTEGLEPLAGSDASVWVECDQELLQTGGRFTGTVEVRRQGNVGILYLTELDRS